MLPRKFLEKQKALTLLLRPFWDRSRAVVLVRSWDRLSSPGLKRYVILLNIHKRLPKQRNLALTLTFNHLTNELLQATTMLYGLII